MLRAGMESSLDQGCMLEIPFYLASLAEALLAAGRAGDASLVIDEALERSHRTAERWVESDLYRRRAQLRLGFHRRTWRGRSEISCGHSRRRVQWMPGFGNSLPAGTSPASGPSRANGKRRMICSRRSTAGSPRALTPPTLRRPGRCSTSSVDFRSWAMGRHPAPVPDTAAVRRKPAVRTTNVRFHALSADSPSAADMGARWPGRQHLTDSVEKL
jgi:hypothetical protein